MLVVVILVALSPCTILVQILMTLRKYVLVGSKSQLNSIVPDRLSVEKECWPLPDGNISHCFAVCTAAWLTQLSAIGFCCVLSA